MNAMKAFFLFIFFVNFLMWHFCDCASVTFLIFYEIYLYVITNNGYPGGYRAHRAGSECTGALNH